MIFFPSYFPPVFILNYVLYSTLYKSTYHRTYHAVNIGTSPFLYCDFPCLLQWFGEFIVGYKLRCSEISTSAPVWTVLWLTLAALGWGEPYSAPQKMESSTWGETSGPPPVSVDNGTSAWGKPMDTGSSWEDPGRENSGTSGWGNSSMSQPPPHKTG